VTVWEYSIICALVSLLVNIDLYTKLEFLALPAFQRYDWGLNNKKMVNWSHNPDYAHLKLANQRYYTK